MYIYLILKKGIPVRVYKYKTNEFTPMALPRTPRHNLEKSILNLISPGIEPGKSTSSDIAHTSN